MTAFQNKSAIVTGAASGIGLALSKELIARGAHVWLTDINEAGAQQAASSLGSDAHSALLDVRDANAVAQLVAEVDTGHDGLDFMFNNAGIGIGGEMHELGVDHFDRIIDINIRGVTNGIAAAYPRMVAKRQGCIVNTASAAGLSAVPLLTPYAMTKHAVVGLSRSLRIEAEHYGVQVNMLCPSAVETPILDAEMPTDLRGVWRPDVRGYLSKLAAPFPVEKFAKYALDGVESNREFIVAPFQTRLSMVLNRLAPTLVANRFRKFYQEELEGRRAVEGDENRHA